MKIEILADGLFSADAILQKAKTQTVVEKTRAVEDKLLSVLWRTFKKTVATKLDNHQVLLASIAAWASVTASVFKAATSEAYRIGKVYAVNRACGKLSQADLVGIQKAKKTALINASFTVMDEKAIDKLYKQQYVWMGDQASEFVSQLIQSVGEAAIKNGWSQEKSGAILEQTLKRRLGLSAEEIEEEIQPAGWPGDMPEYLQMVAANTATVARNNGSIRGLLEVGVELYEIVNPMDERTCERCAWMNGKQFEVESAAKQMDQELDASTPDEIKAIHPWFNDVKNAISSSGASVDVGHVSAADSAKLAKAGISFPPYHGKCRCAVDMASGTEFTP